MPLNKRRTFRRPLLAALDATFPFQHRPSGEIILCQLGKYGAEINLPITRRTKPSGSIDPGLVAPVNALPAGRTKFRILHVKHFNQAAAARNDSGQKACCTADDRRSAPKTFRK